MLSLLPVVKNDCSPADLQSTSHRRKRGTYLTTAKRLLISLRVSAIALASLLQCPPLLLVLLRVLPPVRLPARLLLGRHFLYLLPGLCPIMPVPPMLRRISQRQPNPTHSQLAAQRPAQVYLPLRESRRGTMHLVFGRVHYQL